MLRVLAGLLLLASVPLLTAAYVGWHLDHNVHRIDGVFKGLEHRPSRPATGSAAHAVNLLVLVTDRRSTVSTAGSGAGADAASGSERPDAMMIVHLPGDRKAAWVLWIPDDSWVAIPGHGRDRIDAAVSVGGPTLAVETVEQLTGVRIDHLAVFDWDGFRVLTDAVGGVDVDTPETARGSTWSAGHHHFGGAEALDYATQRGGVERAGLDRAVREQSFLRSLMQACLHQEMRKNPRMLYDFLDTVTQHLSVDSGWSALDMAKLTASLRNLRSANIRYLTVPVAGVGHDGDRSAVHLAVPADQELWRAVRDDRIEGWAEAHGADRSTS